MGELSTEHIIDYISNNKLPAIHAGEFLKGNNMPPEAVSKLMKEVNWRGHLVDEFTRAVVNEYYPDRIGAFLEKFNENVVHELIKTSNRSLLSRSNNSTYGIVES